jgi:hypothetical protein
VLKPVFGFPGERHPEGPSTKGGDKDTHMVPEGTVLLLVLLALAGKAKKK